MKIKHSMIFTYTSTFFQACTILLRGASKDILMEVERNLQDAMQVARNVMVNPKLLPGGGAVEMAVARVGLLITLLFFLLKFRKVVHHTLCVCLYCLTDLFAPLKKYSYSSSTVIVVLSQKFPNIHIYFIKATHKVLDKRVVLI